MICDISTTNCGQKRADDQCHFCKIGAVFPLYNSMLQFILVDCGWGFKIQTRILVLKVYMSLDNIPKLHIAGIIWHSHNFFNKNSWSSLCSFYIGKQKQLEAEHQEMYVEADHSLHLSTSRSAQPPAEKPGERRLAEMRKLYGKGANKIQAMETTMQLNFDRNCDTKQPKYWPIISLKLWVCASFLFWEIQSCI